MTSRNPPRVSGMFDSSPPALPPPPTATFSDEELAALDNLRAAGRELEHAYRRYTDARERHQRALGVLHQLWGGEAT